MQKLNYSAVLIILLALLGGCKKDKAVPSGPTKTGTRAELTKDSIFLYSKEIYFWYDQLPDYQTFMPRQKPNADSVVSALTYYKLNPKYNLSDPYNRNKYLDKYSFIDDGSIATQLGGTAGDFGFSIFYASENDLRIKYVYESSPAATKGLKRGYQITKINGRTDLNYNLAGNIEFVVDAILSGSSSTLNMTVKAPNGTLTDINLSKATYSINPVLFKGIYLVGSKKVGYLVFNSFTTNAETKLEEAFAYFSANNVNEMVVDLRYNGGGSVETAENLINYLAPSAQNGSVMYKAHYNQLMQAGKATILKNQKFRYNGQLVSYFDFDFSLEGNTSYFSKKGSLNINRVYFIVTGSSASASELVINNLKPVLDVKLIGKRTYGKPVGFFSVRIDKSDLYVPQFQTKNKLNEGDYFDGIPVDKDAFDDVTKEFGDPGERLLFYALYHSATGTFAGGQADFTIKGTRTLSEEENSEITGKLDQNEFKGMVKLKRKAH